MKRIIVSGYFNPLHVGHLEMMENGRGLGDYLIVIINNDQQQLIKKGKVIIPEQDRLRIVQALSVVDEVILSVDSDPTVRQSIRKIAEKYPGDELIFGNGGDRNSQVAVPETGVCDEYGIKMVFDLAAQLDSSSRINRELGQ